MNRFIKALSVLALILALTGVAPTIEINTAFAESNSASAVIEVSSGRFLHVANGDQRLPMASTTKVMTALVVLEHCELNEVVTVPAAAVGVEGSSMYLRKGDQRTVEELLFGLMLRSGNDAAVCLALHTSGNIESFAELMNEKAAELGARNTSFVNPHGLHDDNHYTTAKDLAIISAAAMKNPDFRRIVGSKVARFDDRVYYNKNKMLSSYEGATGVKTGYTKVAGRCLVSSSERNGMEIVCVVLNCYDMWERSKTLMTQAHETYSLVNLTERLPLQEVDVEGGVEQNVNVSVRGPIAYPLSVKEADSVRYEIFLPSKLIAPVKEGAVAGKIDIFVDNCLIFSENLYTIKHVRKRSILDWFKELV